MDPTTAAPVDLAAGDVNVAARQTADYSVSQPVHQQELQGFWQQVQNQIVMSQMQQRQQNTGQQAALQQLGRAAEQQRQWALGTHQTIGMLWSQVQEIGAQQMQMQKEQQQVEVQMQHQIHQQLQQ
jgi:hypothetical protein